MQCGLHSSLVQGLTAVLRPHPYHLLPLHHGGVSGVKNYQVMVDALIARLGVPSPCTVLLPALNNVVTYRCVCVWGGCCRIVNSVKT